MNSVSTPTSIGLLCHLVGLRDGEHAAAGSMGGALVENLVVAELFKISLHCGEETRMYFWRTAASSEVDTGWQGLGQGQLRPSGMSVVLEDVMIL